MNAQYPNYPVYNGYNNYYPQTYNQQYIQPNNSYQQNVTPSTQRRLDFVQGRAAAEIYNVDAGSEVILVDMDNPFVYRKARGLDNKLEPMEIYSLTPYTEDDNKVENLDLSQYVTSEELENRISNEIEKRIKAEVDKRISEISFTPTKKTTTPRKRASS